MAVELLRSEVAADPAARTTFDRAARLAAKVSHPSIVCAFDRGLDGARPFLVTELPRGIPVDALDAWIPPARVVALGRDLADGLAAIHAAGAPHGGVDASRVLLDGERIRIDRIGIAALGHPGASPADDVVDLAAVLYRMLSGVDPEGTEPASTLTFRPAVPPALDDVVLAALRGQFANAATLAARLTSLDIGDDAARDAPEPTPPQGAPPIAFDQPRVHRGRRPWLVPAAVVTAGIVAVALLTVTIVRSVRPDAAARPSAGAVGGGEAMVVAARSFDPFGPDRAENDDRAPLAADGDRTTAWATDRYATAAFGNLKPGVGLVVELGGTVALSAVEIDTPTTGWTAELYAAEGAAPADLPGWGAPAHTFTADTAAVAFPVDITASRILLWITSLGPGNRVEIAEARVVAR